MKNIKLSSRDPFDFHKSIISSKRKMVGDPTYKVRVSHLNAEIERLIAAYQSHFAQGRFDEIVSNNYTSSHKDDLLLLYNYKNKIIQELKIEVTTDEYNRICNVCQNCTIGEIGSFDHALPKSEFCEHVVNPINLIPSCSKCNSIKGEKWKEGDKRLFLNLYYDSLPDAQYLFVNIVDEGGIYRFEYYLENCNDIDPKLYQLISSHYERLNLFQRFSENSADVVTGLENDIVAYLGILSIEDIISTAEQSISLNKKKFGANFWKCILQQELLKHEAFVGGCIRIYNESVLRNVGL